MEHPSHHARRAPDRIAIRMAGSGETRTYAQLDAASNRAAHLFRGLGIGADGHVAALLENRPEFLEIYWACQRAGIHFTAISRYLGAEEVAYIARDCGARAFIASPATGPAATAAAATLAPDVARFAMGGALPGFASWEAALSARPATPVADESKGHPMLYSSGTTGRPKGVKRPYAPEPIEGAHPLVRLILKDMGAMTEDSVYLSPAPLYHAAPLAACATAQSLGAEVVVMEKFEPEGFLRAVAAHRASHAQLVPTMFVRMLKAPPEVRAAHDLSSLRCAVHAAAPCPVDVKRAMIDWWGPILLEYYAGTEGNGVAIATSGDWLAHPGTVGRSMIGGVRIVGEDGRELPRGQVGDVYFDAGIPFEYHNDPEKTARAHHPEGWSTLGDVGWLSADGFLHLTDRRAYTIISGGVNVYPQETEDRLLMHPAVRDAAVFGVPDEDLGEAVKAVVQLLDPTRAGPEMAAELIGWCRAALSGIKTPRSVDFRDDMPRTETGKLLKRRLKDEYWPAPAPAPRAGDAA